LAEAHPESDGAGGGAVIQQFGWYVLKTKPNREGAVERSLSLLDVLLFAPRIVEQVWISDAAEARGADVPNLSVRTCEPRAVGRRLRYTPGVRDFLRSDGEPQCISPEIVDRLRAFVGPTATYEPPQRAYVLGERLRIAEGPLCGLEVDASNEKLSGSERVAVLLSQILLQARVLIAGTALSRPDHGQALIPTMDETGSGGAPPTTICCARRSAHLPRPEIDGSAAADLRRWARTLKKRRWAIAETVLVALLATTAIVFALPRRFTATAVIQIDRQAPKVARSRSSARSRTSSPTSTTTTKRNTTSSSAILSQRECSVGHRARPYRLVRRERALVSRAGAVTRDG